VRSRLRAAARATAVLTAAALVCGACSIGSSVPTPWADRPVVTLAFDVPADLQSVRGQERVEFTPDLATCELVFRAWPNKPATSAAGDSLVVQRAAVDGRQAELVDVASGAPDDAPAGTLLRIPLDDCLEPGQRVTVDLDFTLQLGPDVDERVGTSSTLDVAWFGTAFPLLAWVRGRGWDSDPAVAVTGEMAVSEDFQLASLDVTAPSSYAVTGAGRLVGTTEGAAAGTTRHRFTASAVRDVTVSVGDLEVAERRINGVQVHLAADRAADASTLAEWAAQIRTSMDSLVTLLGPFPYDDLWVTVLSSESSGIEFPGAVQFADVDVSTRSALVTHELAHMWFHGLVGSDQGTDPWLDESFATFAQLVADGQSSPTDQPSGAARDDVGETMAYWLRFRQPSSVYYDTVYTEGGAALVEARDRAGHAAFDDALRSYLRDNAYSVATPADVAAAFADLPEALAVLRRVGALPPP